MRFFQWIGLKEAFQRICGFFEDEDLWVFQGLDLVGTGYFLRIGSVFGYRDYFVGFSGCRTL